jgi:hypothetical protein
VEGGWRGEAHHGGLFWLAIWSQNYILPIKNVKIKCMCKILKSYNFTQLLGKHQNPIYGPNTYPKINENVFKKLLSYLACSQILLNISCGSSPIWLLDIRMFITTS